MTGNFPRRGSIYWVSLDPSIGSETKKTRPCMIISNDQGNEFSQTVIVAPVTSKIKKVYSFEVQIEIEGKKGKIMLNQCRTVDKSRLGTMICVFNGDVMEGVNNAIRIAFGLT